MMCQSCISHYQIQFYTKRLLNVQSTKFQTDNVNTMNDYFENSIPSIILPKFKAVLRAKNSEVKDVTVEFGFNLLPGLLTSLSVPSDDVMATWSEFENKLITTTTKKHQPICIIIQVS